MAGTIDKFVCKFKNGWVRVTESDIIAWETSNKLACRVDCLEHFYTKLLADPTIDPLRSSGGTYMRRNHRV